MKLTVKNILNYPVNAPDLMPAVIIDLYYHATFERIKKCRNVGTIFSESTEGSSADPFGSSLADSEMVLIRESIISSSYPYVHRTFHYGWRQVQKTIFLFKHTHDNAKNMVDKTWYSATFL